MKKKYMFFSGARRWNTLINKFNNLYKSIKEGVENEVKLQQKINKLQVLYTRLEKMQYKTGFQIASTSLAVMLSTASVYSQTPIELLSGVNIQQEISEGSNTFNDINIGNHSAPVFVFIDADEYVDLVVGTQNGYVKVFKGNADNTFSTGYNLQAGGADINVGSFATPTFTDINNNAKVDLVVGNKDGKINVFRRDANNNFNGGYLLSAGGTVIDVGNSSAPAFSDIDEDGNVDLIVGDQYGYLQVFKGGASNTFNAGYNLEVSGSEVSVNSYSKPTFADIDTDGNIDLIVGDKRGYLAVFRGNEDFTFGGSYLLEVDEKNADVGEYSSPVLVDFDGDGDIDLISGNEAGNVILYKSVVGQLPEISVLGNDVEIVDGDIISSYTDNTFFGNNETENAFKENTFVIKNEGDAVLELTDLGTGFVTISGANADDFTVVTQPETDIAVGDESVFVISFNPSETGERNATITINNNDLNESEYTFAIQGGGTTIMPIDLMLGVNIEAETLEGSNVFEIINDEEYRIPTFADIDGDGNQDLIIGEFGGYIKVFKANENNTFKTGYNLQSNNYDIKVESGAAVTFADVNADESIDVIVGEIGGTIRVFENKGDNTFDVPYNLQANGVDLSIEYAKPVFEDVDGDGFIDLVVGEKGGAILVHTGNSDNTFNSAYTLQAGEKEIKVSGNSAPTFADVDNDGNKDLVVGAFLGNITVFKGNANHTFASGYNLKIDDVNINVGQYSAPVFVDFDNDGDIDLISGSNNGSVKLFKNKMYTSPEISIVAKSVEIINGDNTPSISNDTYFGANEIESTHIDKVFTIRNLGDTELKLSDIGGKYANITGDTDEFAIITQPNAVIEPGTSTNFTIRFNPTSVGNKFAQIIIANNDTDEALFSFDIKGLGTKSTPIILQPGVKVNYKTTAEPITFNNIDIGTLSAPAFADIDNDGIKDLVIGGKSGFINICKGNSDGGFAEAYNLQSNGADINVGMNSTPTFIDVDNDGDEDLVVGNMTGKVTVFKGDVFHPFDTSYDIEVDGSVTYTSPAFADIDNDGNVDLVVGVKSGEIKILDGKADNMFNEIYHNIEFANGTELENIGSQSPTPSFADVDGDGNVDLIVGLWNGKINVYRGNSDNTFNSPYLLKIEDGTVIDLANASAPVFVDFDDDGDVDLISGDSYGNVTFFENGISQSITFNNFDDAVYGDEDILLEATSNIPDLVVTFSSSNEEVATIVDGKIHVTGAGTCNIIASQYGSSEYANAPIVSKEFKVDKKDVSVIAVDVEKVYNGDVYADLISGTLEGVISDDDVSVGILNVVVEFETYNVGTDLPVALSELILKGNDANNYSILPHPSGLVADITPKELIVSGVTATDKIYNANTDVVIDLTGAMLSNLVAEDNVTVNYDLATAHFNDKNAGIDKQITVSDFSISGEDAINYSISQQTFTADITPLTITVPGINAVNKIYNGDAFAVLKGGILTGVIEGDEASMNYEDSVAEFEDENVGIEKSVTTTSIALSGIDEGNYTVELPPVLIADIVAKVLTVTANNIEVAYNEVIPELTFTYDGFIDEEDETFLTTIPEISTDATAFSDEGNYDIVVSGGLADNYRLVYVSGSLTVGILTLDEDVLYDIALEVRENITDFPTANNGDIIGTTTDDLVYYIPGNYVINWEFTDINGVVFTQTQNIIVYRIYEQAGVLNVVVDGDFETQWYVGDKPVSGGTNTLTFEPTIDGVYTIAFINDSTNTKSKGVVVGEPDTTNPIPDILNLQSILVEVDKNIVDIPTADNGVITAFTSDEISFETYGTYQVNWNYVDYSFNSFTQRQEVVAFSVVEEQKGVFKVNIEGEFNYQWYVDGVEIADANSNTYKPSAVGVYNVEVSSNVSKAFSRSISFGILAVDKFYNETNNLSACPNPTTNNVIIKNNNQKLLDIQVYDSKSILFTKVISDNSEVELDLSTCPGGVLMVLIKSDDEVVVKKIIKK